MPTRQQNRLLLRSTLRASYLQQMLAIQSASLLAYWPLDDASGTVARDASGNSRTGVYTNAALNQTGIGDGLTAPSFSGTGYAAFNAATISAALNKTEGYADLWFKAANSGVWSDGVTRQMLQIGDAANNNLALQKNATTNQISAKMQGAGTSRGLNITLASVDTNWHHFAICWSATDTTTRIFFDGVQQATTLGAPVAWNAAANRAILGAFSTTPSAPWIGALAHAGLWSAPLIGIDVSRRARCTRHIIFDGDSRTATGGVSGIPYPVGAMATVNAGRRYGAINHAVSGQTLVQMLADIATQITPQVRSDTPSIVVLWGGINDMQQSDGSVTATTMFNTISAYGQAVRAAGQKFVVCTETPASNQAAIDRGWNTMRASLNTLIRNAGTSLADAIADLAANTSIGVDGASDNTTYYNADKLHLTDAGYGVVAGIVATAIGTL